MANRNRVSEVALMRNRIYGEKNLICTVLSKEYGLLDVVAYGAHGANGKLSVVKNILGVGTAYLYGDNKNNLNTLSDFELQNAHFEIRNNIEQYLYASLWIELILITCASGSEYRNCFSLFTAALNAFSLCAHSTHTQLISIRFIWKYLLLNGIRPKITRCQRCQSATDTTEHLYYAKKSGELMCAPCYNMQIDEVGDIPHNYIQYPARMAQILRFDMNSAVDDMLSKTYDPQTIVQLSHYMYAVIEYAIGRPLKSIRVIDAIDAKCTLNNS